MNLCARIENLNVSAGAQVILDGLSLECPDRAITVLVGRSGSGKTTLLRSLNRLNEHFPALRTSGRVEVKIGGAPSSTGICRCRSCAAAPAWFFSRPTRCR